MTRLLWLLVLCGSIVVSLNGCSKKAAVKSHVSELERVFQDTGPAAATPHEQPAADTTANAPSDAKVYVNLALSAVQSNDYAGGVILLQQAQLAPKITAEQHRAVYETMQAMTADLVARAEKGDAQAKAQLSAIERTRSQ
ncbi:MAG: hypothetical protein ABI651_08240 [Verrucomicrobiota bacterium]